MLLACPNCTTTYEVKAAVVGENGRSLRCARCHHVWFATRSQELVFAAKPVETGATAELAPVESAPAVPDAGTNPLLAPDFASPSRPTAPGANVSESGVEAPPLAPATPGGSSSPSRAALTAEGED